METAMILLVDCAGALLMQHRDEHATIAPNRWGLPGGLVEPGELPIQAAHRELQEETGLTSVDLEVFWAGPRPPDPSVDYPITMHAFCARTDATDRDIVLGEGRAITFIPAPLALQRDLAVSAAFLIPMFLSSEQYRRLAGSDG